jgi:spermidine synthase
MNIKDFKYTFTNDYISNQYGDYIMHRWEDPLMKAHADAISFKGADILEFGFGMGISADYIQAHNPKSHTICECHPQVLPKLYEWAKGKSGIKILEGNWFSNVNNFKKYDGIFFDTHLDYHEDYFFKKYNKWLKTNGKMTFFNPSHYKRMDKYFKNSNKVEYKIIKTDKKSMKKDREYKGFDEEYYIPIVTLI